MKNYLFLLGRNPELSRAELLNFCEEVYFDAEKSLFIGTNVRFKNPRNLPKPEEQVFLDRLGGTIRFGEVVGEFFGEKELKEEIWRQMKTSSACGHLPFKKREAVSKVGFSVFGAGKNFLKDLVFETKDFFSKKGAKIRVENFGMNNMSSGQIFKSKILKRFRVRDEVGKVVPYQFYSKGAEFVVWKNGNSFLLARTVASQNLRNYEFRDRKKGFRDAKMGMLPPKLAQILVNLAVGENPPQAPFDKEGVIWDPFCGSGTVLVEAAVMGFPVMGSDLNPAFVEGAKKNFSQMAEHFQFSEADGRFFPKDATEINWEDFEGVIATEGFLGTNFDSKARVTSAQIEEEARTVLKIWEQIFKSLQDSKVERIAFCLPAWNTREGKISVSEKLFAKIEKNFYTPAALFDSQDTFFYERDTTRVCREICVVQRTVKD